MTLNAGESDRATGRRRSDTVDMPTKPVWQADPTELALVASAEMRETPVRENLDGTVARSHYITDDLPDVFCYQIGTRLLLMQLRFSHWVLRRVEKVAFERDRSVSRRITIEINVPEDAPEFLFEDEKYWLIPLSIMRRRTLVNLDLRDEVDRSVGLPGLRLNQQFDASVLLAAAAAAGIQNLERGTPLRQFIQKVVAGTHGQVFDEMQAFEGKKRQQPAHLEEAARSRLFSDMVHRLKSNFTLYVFLLVKMGRHRLLRMWFDEPVDWKPRRAVLAPSDNDGQIYTPNQPLRRLDFTHLKSSIGFSPIRIRFQAPSAENAASYHFEITAPPGLRIVEASFLAGRPNEPERHVSADHVVGHSPTTGLHAVEIPHGSLCRAQVDLRVPAYGWLGTVLITCVVIFLVLLSVARHSPHPRTWSPDQVTNIIALLIAAAAGGAALIAQREFGGLAARLVTYIRMLAVIALGLPIVVAGFLAYESQDGNERLGINDQIASWSATILALLIATVVSVSWWRARDSRSGDRPSPWDMTQDIKLPSYGSFDDAREALGFDTPAVGVRSAEGWHERYEWTDARLQKAIKSLLDLRNDTDGSETAVSCRTFQTNCISNGLCPTAHLGTADAAEPT